MGTGPHNLRGSLGSELQAFGPGKEEHFSFTNLRSRDDWKSKAMASILDHEHSEPWLILCAIVACFSSLKSYSLFSFFTSIISVPKFNLPPSSKRSHHPSQPLKLGPPLIHNLHERLIWPNITHNDMILTVRQTFIRLLRECIEWHPELTTRCFSHSAIMKLGLHWRWPELDDLDIRFRMRKLIAETHDESIERGLGSGVSWDCCSWDEGKVRGRAARCQSRSQLSREFNRTAA